MIVPPMDEILITIAKMPIASFVRKYGDPTPGSRTDAMTKTPEIQKANWDLLRNARVCVRPFMVDFKMLLVSLAFSERNRRIVTTVAPSKVLNGLRKETPSCDTTSRVRLVIQGGKIDSRRKEELIFPFAFMASDMLNRTTKAAA